jgi:hypothetical protein
MSAKDADACRQTAKELTNTSGGAFDTAAVLREVRRIGQQLAQPNERTHNSDVHVNRASAGEYAREYRYALFSEGIGRIASTAPSFV